MNFTPEQQLEAIDKQIALYEDKIELAAQSGDSLGESFYSASKKALQDFKAELTKPKQEFAEGQVVLVSYLEDDQPTGEYVALDADDLEPYQAHKLKSCRPLTAQEAGPDFIPKAKADKLVEAIKKVASNPGTNEQSSRDLWDALDAYSKGNDNE